MGYQMGYQMSGGEGLGWSKYLVRGSFPPQEGSLITTITLGEVDAGGGQPFVSFTNDGNLFSTPRVQCNQYNSGSW